MKRSERTKSAAFVADGRERAVAGAAREFEAAIREKYAERLREAGMIGRLWLRLRMRFEIRRQMRREREKIAPAGALYLMHGRAEFIGDSTNKRRT